MMEGERTRDSNEATSSLVTRYNDRFSGLGELLPGIPNDITVKQISTKLSWSALPRLSSVSRAWRQAIQSRLIYDTRVKSHATETLVLLNHGLSYETRGIALYSLREKTLYILPPIPNVESGFPTMYEYVGFNGKIYVFGASRSVFPERELCSTSLESKKVYVLDLGGQRQWKECASRQKFRAGGGCGVMDGKVYVFGSTVRTYTSEVYDPNTDAWSSIEPIPSQCGLEDCLEVASAGEELFVFSKFNWQAQGWAYHPVKLTWRSLPLPYYFLMEAPGKVFITQGKFHAMSWSAISVYDFDTNSWTVLHSSSLAGIAPGYVRVEAVLPVDGELLAVIYVIEATCSLRSFLIQSQRFNSEDKEIVWQKVRYPLPGNEDLFPTVMFPLQL